MFERDVIGRTTYPEVNFEARSGSLGAWSPGFVKAQNSWTKRDAVA